MMGIDGFDATYFATLFVEAPRLNCPLHSEMCFVFARVGTPPVRLPGIGFEHIRSIPVRSFV
jgi:hypothetical protein